MSDYKLDYRCYIKSNYSIFSWIKPQLVGVCQNVCMFVIVDAKTQFGTTLSRWRAASTRSVWHLLTVSGSSSNILTKCQLLPANQVKASLLLPGGLCFSVITFWFQCFETVGWSTDEACSHVVVITVIGSLLSTANVECGITAKTFCIMLCFQYVVIKPNLCWRCHLIRTDKPKITRQLDKVN